MVAIPFSICSKIQNSAFYQATYLCVEYDSRLKQRLCLCNGEFVWFVKFEISLEHDFHIIDRFFYRFIYMKKSYLNTDSVYVKFADNKLNV